MEITKQATLQQCRMQFGNAIDRKTPDDGEMCHSYHRFGTLFDHRHTLPTFKIIRPAARNFGDKSRVDFANDFQHPRQQYAQQPHRPALQRLRQ